MSDVPVRTSENFCNPETEYVFQSSDNVNFHIHRVNLDASATGFPSPETPCHINIINLPETAATLELLFRFIYPLELPDLDEEKFEALYMLAEAAEKYRVYTAIALCKTILKQYSHSHPAELLGYAARHGYKNIADEAAPLMIATPLADLIMLLPSHVIVSWCRFYGAWLNARTEAFLAAETSTCCHRFTQHICPILLAIGKDLGALQDVEAVFAQYPLKESPIPWGQTRPERCCERQLSLWKQSILEAVHRIPNFSGFI